jgi:hypothetical protein
VIRHFFKKQWHEEPSEGEVDEVVGLVLNHLELAALPPPIYGAGKFPPLLKIRGLLHRTAKADG